MASNIVKEHEEEFSRISAEITVLCGKLKHSPTLVSHFSIAIVNTMIFYTKCH